MHLLHTIHYQQNYGSKENGIAALSARSLLADSDRLSLPHNFLCLEASVSAAPAVCWAKQSKVKQILPAGVRPGVVGVSPASAHDCKKPFLARGMSSAC